MSAGNPKPFNYGFGPAAAPPGPPVDHRHCPLCGCPTPGGHARSTVPALPPVPLVVDHRGRRAVFVAPLPTYREQVDADPKVRRRG